MGELPVYLDYNATTPIDPKVIEKMLPFLTEHFGNPSSAHAYGRRAAEAVAAARGQVARLIEARPSEIVFLSGGTESINYAIKGSAEAAREAGRGNHLITTVIEHVAVLETCKYLETKGFEVTYLPVSSPYGVVQVEDVLAAIRPETVLISIMHSNNEIGTIQPIQEIVRRVKEIYPQVLVHTDASQSIGKVEVSVPKLGVDFLTMAGHKMYAPKGIGALYIKDGTAAPVPLMHGAGHEDGRRAGTENVSLICALGEASNIARDSLTSGVTNKLKDLRNMLRDEILQGISLPTRINSAANSCLPNTLSISFKGLQAQEILGRIKDSVAASAGSACHSQKDGSQQHISYVLRAIGLESDYGAGTLRLSVGKFTTEDEVGIASQAIIRAVNELTGMRKVASDLDASRTNGGEKTKLLYFNDTYTFDATATVQGIQREENGERLCLYLDQTIFHPQGGGQPCDVGTITSTTNRAVFAVADVRMDKDNGRVCHYGTYIREQEDDEDEFAPGDNVRLQIDEAKRRLHARLHSAGHVLDRAMKEIGYDLIPGKSYHFIDGPFVEYKGKLSADVCASMVPALNASIEKLIAQSIVTQAREVAKDEAEKECRTDLGHLDDTQPVRVVNVAGLSCPCGGTHVRNTSELGIVQVTRVRSKGGNTKVYYTVSS